MPKEIYLQNTNDRMPWILSVTGLHAKISTQPLTFDIRLSHEDTISHGLLAPDFKPQPGSVRGVFHLSLRLITFGGHSIDLFYHVHRIVFRSYSYIRMVRFFLQVYISVMVTMTWMATDDLVGYVSVNCDD